MQIQRHMATKSRESWEARGRDCRGAASGQGMWGLSEGGRGKDAYPPLGVSEEAWPCLYLDFGLLASYME